MKVEYGPPGIGGVKSLQYLSDNDAEKPDVVSKYAILGAAAASIFGKYTAAKALVVFAAANYLYKKGKV